MVRLLACLVASLCVSSFVRLFVCLKLFVWLFVCLFVWLCVDVVAILWLQVCCCLFNGSASSFVRSFVFVCSLVRVFVLIVCVFVG